MSGGPILTGNRHRRYHDKATPQMILEMQRINALDLEPAWAAKSKWYLQSGSSKFKLHMPSSSSQSSDVKPDVADAKRMFQQDLEKITNQFKNCPFLKEGRASKNASKKAIKKRQQEGEQEGRASKKANHTCGRPISQ